MADQVKNTYDGVVLAAGKNTRLKGLVPSYYKPLVIVHGRPLIVSIVKNLRVYCEHVIIVVSTKNCDAIAEVLDDNDLLDEHVTLMLQTSAQGPGDAVILALRAVRSERVVLVCGDNIVPEQDFRRTYQHDRESLARGSDSGKQITVSTWDTTDEDEGERFTRVYRFNNTIPYHFMENQSGGFCDGDEHGNGQVLHCWIGPVIFDAAVGRDIFERFSYDSEGEVKISGAFNLIPDRNVIIVPGHSIDIGTSDALVQISESKE